MPPNTALNPTEARITIVNPTAADGAYVRTEYKYIREYVKAMHQQYGEKDIDLFVHIGMAMGWGFVSVERFAFRQGMSSTWWREREKNQYYMIPDNSGHTIEELPNPWMDVPTGLQSAFDVDDVVEGARTLQTVRKMFTIPTTSPDSESAIEQDSPMEVKAHHEGGPYGCGQVIPVPLPMDSC